MDAEIGKYIASGGVSGAVVVCFYFVYKTCYRKKCRSKCWGAELDVKGEGEHSPDTQSKKDVSLSV